MATYETAKRGAFRPARFKTNCSTVYREKKMKHLIMILRGLARIAGLLLILLGVALVLSGPLVIALHFAEMDYLWLYVIHAIAIAYAVELATQEADLFY